MKITLGELRRIIREVAGSVPGHDVHIDNNDAMISGTDIATPATTDQAGNPGLGRGLGLGLPLARSLAEANKAAFDIESTPGRGTTVRITFAPTSVLAT